MGRKCDYNDIKSSNTHGMFEGIFPRTVKSCSERDNGKFQRTFDKRETLLECNRGYNVAITDIAFIMKGFGPMA